MRGTGTIYVSFEEISGTVARSASNAPRALIHVMQVDIWSRAAISPELYPVLRALWAAGITVDSWGPLIYEDDTGWYHMPITCRYNERIRIEGVEPNA